MPTYAYACSACEHAFDVRQSFSDSPLTTCPACARESLRKLFSPVGVVFKGSGFYRTDSRAASRAAKDGAPSPGTTPASTPAASSDGSSSSGGSSSGGSSSGGSSSGGSSSGGSSSGGSSSGGSTTTPAAS